MVDSKAIKERSAKKNTGNRSKGNQNSPHKHCRMCGIDISIKSEKRVCSNEECTKKMGKQEKNDKMMRIMFFVFAFAIALPILLQLFGFGR